MLSIRTKLGRPYRVYILAGNKAEADAYAKRINLHHNEYLFVIAPCVLCGVVHGLLITTGTYYLRDDVDLVLLEARTRRLLRVTDDEFEPLTTLAVQLYNRSLGEKNEDHY